MSSLYLAAALLGYGIGSIPTGYWIGLMQGVDVRKFGSGNLGATNVFRTLGWKAGAATLIIDVTKGFLAVKAASLLITFAIPTINSSALVEGGTQPFDIELFLWTAGISAILGHSFSPFVKFRGGKGVATAGGIFLALLPMETGIALAVFAFVFAISHIVSLSSIIASLSLAIATIVMPHDRWQTAWTTLVAVFVILRHRSNIVRLMNGTENRLEFSGKKLA